MLKFKELDDKKKRMVIIVSILVLFIGVSLAYVVAQLSGGAFGDANITSDTTDNLTFSVSKDISLNPTQFNVTEGGGGLSDTAVGTASLLANSTNNTFSTTYYVYFNINSNNYIYTTTDQKPEIVLTITDPNGNPVTELPNNDLTYVTAENADGTTVSGFDITTASGLFNIASLYPISSTSSTDPTVQNWTFTVTFINLTTNQTENGGKTLNAEIVLSREVYTNPDTVLTAYSNGALTTHTLGNYDISLDCSMGSAVWDNKAGGVVIDFTSANRAKCNVNYTERDSVTYLNNYIIGLSGTTQGTGQVVNEVASIPDYTLTTVLNESQYGTPRTYSSSSYSSTSGTATTETFTYSGGEWNSVPSEMTSGTYYHFRFTPEESGYYQICYNVSAGNSSNRLYAYVNTTNQRLGGSTYVSASISTTKSGCQSLGYLSTSDTVRVAQRAYSSSSYGIATISFRLEKTNVVNDVAAGYRYEGKDPNNYVWFNNELWRIIGVFDENSHGVSGQNLVKIIRNESIGGLAWDNSNGNGWTQASLMNLLNGAYLNSENGTGGEYCYGYYITIPANCDYRETGINDTYRPMIENVTWYLGGYSFSFDVYATAEELYGYERGDIVYSGSPTETTGYIGLMYPSDYGYGVLASDCSRTRDLGEYNTAWCSGQDWLYGQGNEWTITPNTDYSNSVLEVSQNIASNNGNMNFDVVASGSSVRPVLYLDSNVYIYDGTGTQSDPYIIGM